MEKALKLAGKIAIRARRVIDSNALNLSNSISNLKYALDEYDKHIFEITKEKTKK